MSNFGSQISVVAPGTDILSTLPNNSTGLMTGTSMAAPHVAGVAALLLSVNPCLTQKMLVDILEVSAQKIRTDLFTYSISADHPNGLWNAEAGYGLVDAAAALNMALGDSYLQSSTETSAALRASSKGRILAGYNVTTTKPLGNYIIANNANVEIKSPNSITFYPGFSTSPGAILYAHISSFNGDCAQWAKNFKTDNNDLDKTGDVFPIVSLTKVPNNIDIYPNPFTNDFHIKFNVTNDNTNVSIVISDITGKVVYEQKKSYDIGNQDLLMNIQSTSSILIVKVRIGNEFKIQKLIKYDSN